MLVILKNARSFMLKCLLKMLKVLPKLVKVLRLQRELFFHKAKKKLSFVAILTFSLS